MENGSIMGETSPLELRWDDSEDGERRAAIEPVDRQIRKPRSMNFKGESRR